MNGRIPTFDWYLDDRKESGVKWNIEFIKHFQSKFTPFNIRNDLEGISPYGHEVCVNLLQSFEDYNISNKKVAVIGSETPWIEAILLNMSNNVTTIEYNVPDCDLDDKLRCKGYHDHFEKNTEKYEAIITFSSIEHSGLGRYGDPLDPNGDIKTMNNIFKNLTDDGLVIWGAPVGKDALAWNAHRVYGPVRLPLIFQKFTELKWYGYNKEELFSKPLQNNAYQPVVVLRKHRDDFDFTSPRILPCMWNGH